MSEKVDRLLQAALELPDEEQVQLVTALEAAVEERGLWPLDERWLEEIHRRSAEYDAGLVQPVSWSAVKERARTKQSAHE